MPLVSSLSRHALQAVIAVAGLVPVGAGIGGLLIGPSFTLMGSHERALPAGLLSLDSHFRYLSGLLLGVGLVFWWAIPSIERRGTLVRALTLIVAVGGLSRLFSVAEVGAPDLSMRLALIMELIITPAICLWQYRLERQMDAATQDR